MNLTNHIIYNISELALLKNLVAAYGKQLIRVRADKLTELYNKFGKKKGQKIKWYLAVLSEDESIESFQKRYARHDIEWSNFCKWLREELSLVIELKDLLSNISKAQKIIKAEHFIIDSKFLTVIQHCNDPS